MPVRCGAWGGECNLGVDSDEGPLLRCMLEGLEDLNFLTVWPQDNITAIATKLRSGDELPIRPLETHARKEATRHSHQRGH